MLEGKKNCKKKNCGVSTMEEKEKKIIGSGEKQREGGRTDSTRDNFRSRLLLYMQTYYGLGNDSVKIWK